MPRNTTKCHHTTDYMVRFIGEAGIQMQPPSRDGKGAGHEGAGFTEAFYVVHRESMRPELTVEVSQLTAGHVVATEAESLEVG